MTKLEIIDLLFVNQKLRKINLTDTILKKLCLYNKCDRDLELYCGLVRFTAGFKVKVSAAAAAYSLKVFLDKTDWRFLSSGDNLGYVSRHETLGSIRKTWLNAKSIKKNIKSKVTKCIKRTLL